VRIYLLGLATLPALWAVTWVLLPVYFRRTKRGRAHWYRLEVGQ
jgi:hypothetical protein